MKNLERAFALFDAYNRNSPEHLVHEGTDYPAEYFYAIKLHEWVTKLAPEASKSLLLASRAQHIGRWEIARNTYEEGRVGYLKWRTDLSKFHASKAAEIMESVGYDAETIERVQQIIRKQKIKADDEVQTMENALCLVFLEYQYDDLIAKTSEEKMITILQKTWAKMSEPGRNQALSLHYSDEGKRLINMALSAP